MRRPGRAGRLFPRGPRAFAGLAFLEGPLPRWLAIADLVISLRLGHVALSISWSADACGHRLWRPSLTFIYRNNAIYKYNANYRCRIQQGQNVRPSSAADPLPTPFRRTRFPLSPGLPESHSRN